jgi:hypothetical protein
VDNPPHWMTKSDYERIAKVRTFDVEAEPVGWLATLVKEAGQE